MLSPAYQLEQINENNDGDDAHVHVVVDDHGGGGCGGDDDMMRLQKSRLR